MALPHTLVAGDEIFASELNANFVYTDYTAIDNNKSIRWDNALTVPSASIVQDSSDNLVFNNTDGIFNFTGARVGINDSSPERRLHVNGGTDNVVAVFESTDATAAIEFRDDTTTAGYVRVQALGNTLQFAANNLNYITLTTGGIFEIYDATLADKITLEHDGSNAYIETNTGGLHLNPSGNILVQNGRDVFIYDSTNTDYLQFRHDGSNAQIVSNAGNVRVTPQSSSFHFQVRSGSNLEVYNGSNASKIVIDHDGSNGIISTDTGGIYMQPVDGNFRVYEASAGSDYIRAGHNGIEAFITSSNDLLELYTTYVSIWLGDVVDPDIIFEGQSSSQFILRDGFDFVIEEASGSGAGVMYHDGTHFWFETTVGTDDLIFDATNGTGQVTIIQPTDNIKFVDASDTGGTVSGYLQLNVGGSTRYIRLNTTA